MFIGQLYQLRYRLKVWTQVFFWFRPRWATPTARRNQWFVISDTVTAAFWTSSCWLTWYLILKHDTPLRTWLIYSRTGWLFHSYSTPGCSLFQTEWEENAPIFSRLRFTLSCTRCTSQCCPSAARHRSEWRQRCCCWLHGTPPWSARSCRCWQSSGMCLVAPDTPQRAALESLLDSCLKTSETDRHPHHPRPCAAVTGNDISATRYCTRNLLIAEIRFEGLILLYPHFHMERNW